MIRFANGVPQSIWYSQHANGSAYAFSAVLKDDSGKRVRTHRTRIIVAIHKLTSYLAHRLRSQRFARPVRHARNTRPHHPQHQPHNLPPPRGRGRQRPTIRPGALGVLLHVRSFVPEILIDRANGRRAQGMAILQRPLGRRGISKE